MFLRSDVSFQVGTMSPSPPFLLYGPYPGLWEIYLLASHLLAILVIKEVRKHCLLAKQIAYQHKMGYKS